MKTSALLLKNSGKAKVIGITTFIMLVTLYLVYRRGKSQGIKEENTKIIPVPLPDINYDKGVTEDVAKRVRFYSLSLFEDLTEIFGLRDTDIYKRLSAESDNVLISVYNDFNNLYGKEEKGSLTKWIQDELIQTSAMKSVLDRFLNLNLK
ncbi:hypothetical protein [Pseudotamlana carrageenivorans]|uniref:Uncharacterized protein n=1 Tax=Pseudotamlana carrageenivorans TaxID=2069432 RepID=A0A2I7SER3_9FLAO|nr:hypothetical protein [Tamlana carrageenivorans]AUS04389.1 hypothetical protein C1A40_02380 [Tamlana carrageenivorans]